MADKDSIVERRMVKTGPLEENGVSIIAEGIDAEGLVVAEGTAPWNAAAARGRMPGLSGPHRPHRDQVKPFEQ